MNLLATLPGQLELPLFASSHDGIEWNPCEDLWVFPCLSGVRSLNFQELRKNLTSELCMSIKHLILYYLQNYSIDHAATGFNRLLALAKFAHEMNGGPISTIKLETVAAYRATLGRRTEWYLGTMRGFFKTWLDLRLPCLDPTVVNWLGEIKLKGNLKGEAIQTLDPLKGAFSDIEFQGIVDALNDQFAKGGIDLEDFILVWLFLALGSRAVQLAALKVKDLQVLEVPGGGSGFVLRVPRAKQRGQHPRSEFKLRKLIPEIGILVNGFVQSVRSKWGHLVEDPDDLPLFYNPHGGVRVPGLENHCHSIDLSKRLDAAFGVLGVRSERTNEPLKITSRRFRYTRGTRAAAEGAGPLVIAELLDHSDTQNAGVYIETVPKILERIDKAMAIYLAPMAQAFAGQLIDGEAQAKRGKDPRSRIFGPAVPGRPVGSCGSFGFCGAAAPIACYTCRSFQPWRDGPHLEVLKALIAERERVLAETNEARIASVNDRTILACAEVVRMCHGAAVNPAEV
jgi:integrase